MNKEVFRLFANCILVRGNQRSMICDIGREKFSFIPNSLFDILTEEGYISSQPPLDLFYEDQITYKEYFDFLLEREFIYPFSPEEMPMFPEISLEWKVPAIITNVILDFITTMPYSLQDIIESQLPMLNCRNVEIRAFQDSNSALWNEIISSINRSEVKNLYLVINDDLADVESDFFIRLVSENPKIRSIVLHSSKSNEISLRPIEHAGCIINVMENITDASHCGFISPEYFSVNIETFTEAQLYNTCLNRKISIDVNGDIKNCPSMAKSYGNIRDTKLIDVANDPEFQKVWHIHKDQIAVCRDCEFRYICTDCRAYLEDPEDMYSKPLKCGYNPYTCEWEEWSTNPLKQQAINYYGMRNMLKNDEDNSPRKSE